jgi:hypothetical protein
MSDREKKLEAAALDFIAKVDRGEARSKESYAAFKDALRAQSDVRAPAPQGEPVAWQWRSSEGWILILQGKERAAALHESGYEVRPLYADPIPPADVFEECAEIAAGHVGAGGYPGDEIEDRCRRIGYNDACRDIAKAIRDAHGGSRS